MTYPEVGEFFRGYIVNAQPLPFEEYFAKIGIRYTEGEPPTFEIMESATPEQLRLRRAWLTLRRAA